MVSAGTVTNDLNSLSTSLNSYTSNISDVSANWVGDSYSNLVSKAEEFVTEYSTTIRSEMTAFSTACSEYEQYQTAKNNLAIARSNYNQAQTESERRTYSAQIAQYESEMNRLKASIESHLQTASATSLAASASTADSSYVLGKALGIDAGTYSDTFTSSSGKSMKYHAYVPENATEGMPLVIYLHGDGSVNNYDYLKNHEMAAVIKKQFGSNYPFVLVQPMTEAYSWTEGGRLDTLSELVQSVSTQYKCDPNKVVIMGGSRGGMGAWQMANKYPDLFSAAVPISGTGNIDASNFSNLPTVAISSPDSSDSWNYSNMQANVKKINDAGGKATFVSANGYNHGDVIYSIEPDLWEWILAQTKSTTNV